MKSRNNSAAGINGWGSFWCAAAQFKDSISGMTFGSALSDPGRKRNSAEETLEGTGTRFTSALPMQAQCSGDEVTRYSRQTEGRSG